MAVQRQLAMVINLDKCFGCQGCTVTCRTHRLNRPGCEMLNYIWCETKPGHGWPPGWMEMGRKVPDGGRDYGGTWTLKGKQVYESGSREQHLRRLVMMKTGELVEWGPVWEEERGSAEWLNGYFFFLPRLCNHCSNAPCVKACEDHHAKTGGKAAMFKREQDGIVMIDRDSCGDCGLCVANCPYKVPMSNFKSSTREMCDFCAVRVENDYAPVCAKSCPARAMYFGYLDDEASYVHKLVKQYKVALPLRPDFGTEPNVYYVPPFMPPLRVETGNGLSADADIPIEVLRSYFGPEVDQALATLKEHRRKAASGEHSEIMDLLAIYRYRPADAFAPFRVEASHSPIAEPNAGLG